VFDSDLRLNHDVGGFEMTEIAIRTENLTRDFDTVRAVDGLSLLTQVILTVAAALVVLNAGFLVAAMARFQRTRLILD